MSQSNANVHCLVHPWFDAFNHEEFEAYIHTYIAHIAQNTNDILLIVSDWESFDREQIKKFAHLDILEAIAMYIWLQDGGLGDYINIYDENGKYSNSLASNGLSEAFYRWCQKNIDMSELSAIAEEWRVLKEEYISWKRNCNLKDHNEKAKLLRERELSARMNLDIEAISYKALEEFWPISQRSLTYRNIKNRWRFFRIFQHAMEALGKDRFREIFIKDGEQVDTLPILPISHFQVVDGEMIATWFVPDGEESTTQVFNASEDYSYWNAARLRDRLTYELSLSRNEALSRQQPKEVLQSMWVEVTENTKFVFFWEYRDRCVNNVLRILNYRLAPITWDNFWIWNNAFTLERPGNYISTAWG